MEIDRAGVKNGTGSQDEKRNSTLTNPADMVILVKEEQS